SRSRESFAKLAPYRQSSARKYSTGGGHVATLWSVRCGHVECPSITLRIGTGAEHRRTRREGASEASVIYGGRRLPPGPVGQVLRSLRRSRLKTLPRETCLA